MKRFGIVAVLLVIGFGAFANQAALRRFAIFVGSNSGGSDRVTLRYAEDDALGMASVLQELGGVVPGDSLLLLGPNSGELGAGFRAMGERIREAQGSARRTEFLLYYSGHSDEQGILLGEERFSYRELKSSIDDVGADVNIAILDSCSSGAFTRLKGGTRQPPFLLDESSEMKGHAFLTSSSADEAAQESDRIEGSFFTHYLIAGMRGAADSTRDGQISLNEAYAYAFSETLARTESTAGGPQHPSYNIQLTGTGDLTVTDLRVASSGLWIQEDVGGRLFVRDQQGRLVVELRKDPSVPVLLALPAGEYLLRMERDGGMYESFVRLRVGRKEAIDSQDFVPLRTERATSRGPIPSWSHEEPFRMDEEELAARQGTPPEDQEPPVLVPFSLGLLPFVPPSGPERAIHQVSLNLLLGSTYEVRGLELGAVINVNRHRMAGYQGAGVGNILEGDLVGVQQAGVFNIVAGATTAYQGAGVFNIVEGRASFLQSAGVFNIAEATFSGVQAAGVFNINGEEQRGVQAAGVFNIGGGSVYGVQAAGVFNASHTIGGAQLGLVNIADRVYGTQIGLVNVAAGEVRGTQVGLVNIARDYRGVPIGLFNFVQNGYFHLSTWFSELGMGYVGVEMGTRHLYSLFYGAVELNASPDLYVAGAGVGLHVPIGMFFVNADLSAKQVLQGRTAEEVAASLQPGGLVSVFPSLRATVGLRLGSFSIFGGILVDTLLEGLTAPTPLHRRPENPGTLELWNLRLGLYPKLFGGVGLQL
ncbi:MAG: caspase family protein [Spirochaetales bacterium]|nr:caspase family protein [Spirochaetales bacterium]